jgi:hypothetical protein
MRVIRPTTPSPVLLLLRGAGRRCFAPVKHQQTTPDGYFDCIMMDPQYQSRWNDTWTLIAPQVQQKQIAGVFLGDEHLYVHFCKCRALLRPSIASRQTVVVAAIAAAGGLRRANLMLPLSCSW